MIRPNRPALFLLLLVAAFARSQSVEPESCSADRNHIDVEPEADITIGALLDLHESGSGVFGCGQPTAEGLHFYEALRWAVNILNQDSGEINGKPVTSSFIPGVKLGLQVYDSCSHKDLAVKYMTDLFPVLKTGDDCNGIDENGTKIIGFVDGTGASNIQRVSDAINRSWIAAIPLDDATAVPPEQIAKVLAEVVHDMEWERVAILHAEDEYSLYVTKIFSQIAFAGYPCITTMRSFPTPKHPRGRDEPSIHKILNSVTGRLPDGSAVIVIAHGDSFRSALQALGNSPDLSRLQWLFSWLLPIKDAANILQDTKSNSLFSLSPYPQKVSSFENYWTRLQQIASVKNAEDLWFVEYAMSKKNCRVPGYGSSMYSNLVMCDDMVIKESSVESLSKTSRFLPAFHSVFTFANAYKDAWKEKCKGLPGQCPELQMMTRNEFVERFLEPLSFEHSEALRSPPEVKGQKTNRSARGEMDNVQMALNAYFYNERSGLYANQVYAYDSQEAKVLDESFRPVASSCPRGGCKNCVSIRQSRLESQDYEFQPSEDFLTIAQSEDVLIPVLLPIHQAGSSPMECGMSLNPEAVQNLEAALWTIDQVNQDAEYLPGVRLGAVIIDTCSSPITLTQRLSNFLMEIQQKRPDDFFSPLAVVSAGGPDEFSAAASVLAPLNVTLVSSTDSVRPKDKTVKHLQTAVPIETKVEAVARLLSYLGWNYVPVVYDTTEHSRELFTMFKQFAKEADICMSTELPVTSLDTVETDYLISQMVQAKEHGAKVIVMWTNEMATNVFVEAIRRAVAARVLSGSDFVIICNGEWIKDINSFKSFENQTVGMLTVKPEQGEVPDFETYYKRLQPGRNKRNPWFEDLWNEVNPCETEDCIMSQGGPVSLYSPLPSTVDMIQAVLSLSAGLARLRSDLCSTQQGLCPKLFQQPHIRELYHKYVLETASTRLDVRGEMFTFTKHGYGNIPMNIFSFRRRGQNTLSYQKVGSYLNYKTEVSGSIIYSATGDEIALEELSSTCKKECEGCQKRTADFLVLDSEDSLYISAAMGVHESTGNPLACGPVIPSSGIQTLEAFLWAIDQVNSSPQLLPGVNLGAIVFDTCNSKERAARDISNFFSGSVVSSSKLPDLSQVVGMLTTAGDDTIEPIVDVTTPFRMLTVATDVSSTKFSDMKKYPTLLRSTLPNDMIAEGLVDLLKHFRWNYVSVVYSDDTWKQGDLFESFKSKADKRNIDMALVEKLPISSYEASVRSLLNRLVHKKEKGARVVVLLLNSAHMRMFFSTVTKQQDSGSIAPGDFVWIGIDNLEVFHTYPDVSLGAVMLRSSTNTIVPFKNYFERLHLKNNTRNPWFREYWEKVFECQGASCHKKNNAANMPLLQHSAVPTVINSVLAIAVGLENVRSRLCPVIQRGLCSAMKDDTTVREMLQNVTRSTSFTGVDGKLFKFTKNSFAAGILEVFNFIQVGSNARAFIEVGHFSPDEGLFLNYSKVKTYDEGGREISLYHIKSQCMDTEECQNKDDKLDVPLMEVGTEQDLAVGIVMPVHQQGKTFFDCGDIRDEQIFQNLVAASYAIDTVNQNGTLMPGINLGTIVFDYCSRRQKAEEQLYRYFSKDNHFNKMNKIKPKSTFATITFGTDVAKDVEPILDASNVVQIVMPYGEAEFEEREDILYAIPPPSTQVQALIGIMKKFNWRYANLIYSNTNFGRSGYYHFSKAAKEAGICLASILMFDTSSTPQFISSTFESELHRSDAKVIAMLIDDARLLNNTILAAKQSSVIQDYTWLGTNNFDAKYDMSQQLQDLQTNFIMVQLENNKLADFVDYFSRMTPHSHEPIPDAWFDNWWQQKFQCRLSDSGNTLNQYSHVCSGNEQLKRGDIIQDTNVYHTVKIIEALVKGLQKYILDQCPDAMRLEDCGPTAKLDLSNKIKKLISGVDPDCEECGPLGTAFGYDVYQVKAKDDNESYAKIGSWRNGLLFIDEQLVNWSSGSVPFSTCLKDCDICTNQLGEVQNLSSIKHDLYANFKEVWGITVSSLSVLGMVLVIICALYFLMSFPVTVGTTVLGYMILFGLLLLYAVNFAFILSPTEGSCGVRRFGLGLAYAVIFSGMLVKVMNTWRIMGYNGSRMLNDGTRMSSPAGLLVIAVGLVIIQILLSSAWLILMPPKIGAYEMVWRCAPPTTFEEGLVVSLVYVMLLLAITTLFAILTWQCQDNNRESRWILACSTMVAVIWLAWTIVSTQISPHHRDLTIAAANLINATIIMVCLYLRKVYLYSKLMRQAKDQELKAHLQPSPHSHSLYGTSQKSGPFSTLAPVLYGSQASLTGKKIYNSPSSRLELINCPEDNKSDSSGSVQVQAADLYPLDMYDGGSQFQPISSLFGSNHTLVLDDTLTFGR